MGESFAGELSSVKWISNAPVTTSRLRTPKLRQQVGESGSRPAASVGNNEGSRRGTTGTAHPPIDRAESGIADRQRHSASRPQRNALPLECLPDAEQRAGRRQVLHADRLEQRSVTLTAALGGGIPSTGPPTRRALAGLFRTHRERELSKPPEYVRISGDLVRPPKRAYSERSAGLRF